MHNLGIVRDPSEAALASYIKRMTGKDDLWFLVEWEKNVAL